MPVTRRRVVKTLLSAAAVAVAEASLPAAAPVGDFYVSPQGNDTWSGRLPQPNRAKTDGPFASVARAQQAVRARVDKTKAVTVLVRGGFYALSSTLAFTGDDSGTPSAPVMFAAYPGETPVLSGGVRITGWTKTGGDRWIANVPNDFYFEQLYVDGERRYRPRLPKAGYYTIAGEVAPSPKTEGKAYDRFRFHAGDIRADWANRGDIELLPFHIWTMDRHRIADVDAKANIVTFQGQTMGTQSYESLPKGARYLIENVKEALSEPGEWYLDRPYETYFGGEPIRRGRSFERLEPPPGLLTYLTHKGKDPNKVPVIAPRLEQLLTVSGTENITFRGLTFAHAAWRTPPTGRQFWQAEANLSAAITLTNARNIAFEDCRIQNVGAWAIDFSRGSQNCRLVRSDLTDLGAGGVKIGEAEMRPEGEAASHITVQDCLIAHGGRIHNAGVGVWIGHSANNLIDHNEIVDLYYTGISPGWSWGYGPSGAHHNTITHNRIHQIGQGVLSDMGGVYTLGVSPGTVVAYNRIHDVDSFDYGGWGIYFDEGSTGIVAENNVVYHTKSAPFHQHYGKDNLVRNNIFAFGQEAQLMRTRPEDHLSFTASHNLIYYRDRPLLGSNWSGTNQNFRLENNLYWNAGKQPVTFPGGVSLASWQAKGLDSGSRIADPGFVAPDKGDFNLRPGSPAAQVGFVPWDQSDVGRRNVPPYRGQVPRAFPPPPPPAPPEPIVDDFERYAPGDKPDSVMVYEEAAHPGANVRVTDETAASGKQSLKFTDLPGQQFSYNPHVAALTKFETGTLVGAFALRHETGVVILHEWRDGANPYHTGAALRIDADGTLNANGKPLLKLPPSTWVRFEITCRLGPQANGKYDLTVTTAGGAMQTFPSLSCVNVDFAALNWWGFVSNTNDTSVFYLDDLSLAPRKA